MPAKSGQGAAQLKQKYSVFVGGMAGPKTQSAMAKILSIGVTGAKELAPLEYGTLMNSAFRRIEKTGAGIRGVAGFTVFYAYYLHEKLNWKPLRPEFKKGPGWNAEAEPKFLEKGFTSPSQIKLMQIALGDEYKL